LLVAKVMKISRKPRRGPKNKLMKPLNFNTVRLWITNLCTLLYKYFSSRTGARDSYHSWFMADEIYQRLTQMLENVATYIQKKKRQT
jgi:hypothetical protein